MNTDPIIRRLLKRHKPSSQFADELRRHMDDQAGRLAYLAECISVRGGATGCGGHPHKSAAKVARRQCIKVNKALGYTYADRRAFDI